jgi:hypothetical protein
MCPTPKLPSQFDFPVSSRSYHVCPSASSSTAAQWQPSSSRMAASVSILWPCVVMCDASVACMCLLCCMQVRCACLLTCTCAHSSGGGWALQEGALFWCLPATCLCVCVCGGEGLSTGKLMLLYAALRPGPQVGNSKLGRGLGSAGRCAVLVPASNVCVCVGGSVGKCDVTLCGT